MPRFVILEHNWPTTHWDFLLEAGEVLRAWRLAEEPAIGRSIAADRNFDHRTRYLEYEGPLSENRGTVRRWEAGQFEWLANAEDEVAVMLHGSRLACRVIIAHGVARFTSE